MFAGLNRLFPTSQGFATTSKKHESAALAQRVAQAVYDAAHSLSSFPKKGRPGREPDTRELVIQRHPYIVVYELSADAVEILRALHTSQQWP